MPALAPAAAVIDAAGGKALSLRARGFASFGKWTAPVARIEGGRYYMFEALYRAENVPHEAVSVSAMLTWNNAEGRAVQRDYMDGFADGPDGWRRLSRTLQAPDRARSADIELGLRCTGNGSVAWRLPYLGETQRPRPRLVRVVTTRTRPATNSTVEGNLRAIGELIDRAAAEKPDLIVMTENPNDRGTGLTVHQTAEPIPGGPTSRLLADKARQHGTWLCMSLHERADDLTYITCALVGRDGRVAAKYRKSHLPLCEAEEGITPGSEYVVADTDFGRVGLLVCWDIWFPEPVRILRSMGAEMILLPIAGDGEARHWDVTTRARALDNGVYLVASCQLASNSRIVDPQGEVMAETAEGIASATIDLNREWRLNWLSVGPSAGQAKSLYLKERRTDTYGGLVRG
jgi:predicted amidohydrolase